MRPALPLAGLALLAGIVPARQRRRARRRCRRRQARLSCRWLLRVPWPRRPGRRLSGPSARVGENRASLRGLPAAIARSHQQHARLCRGGATRAASRRHLRLSAIAPAAPGEGYPDTQRLRRRRKRYEWPMSDSPKFAGAHQPARRNFGIAHVIAGDGIVPVHSLDVVATPFCTLVEFARLDVAPEADLLLIAPLSGHFPFLLRDLVIGLLPFSAFMSPIGSTSGTFPPSRGPLASIRTLPAC